MKDHPICITEMKQTITQEHHIIIDDLILGDMTISTGALLLILIVSIIYRNFSI